MKITSAIATDSNDPTTASLSANWPPSPDSPVVTDDKGKTVSKFRDSIWLLTPWAKRIETMNFGDGRLRKNDPGISKENAWTLRHIAAWWLHGPAKLQSLNSITRKFDILRTLFIFCSQQNISAKELYRFPRIVERLPQIIKPSRAPTLPLVLFEIWEERALLGFHILAPNQINWLCRNFEKHSKQQTAYIPPRIWTYQTNRLKEFIDDFNCASTAIESCFKFMIEAYMANGLVAANKLTPYRRPFHMSSNRDVGSRKPQTNYGSFTNTLAAYDLLPLIEKWLGEIKHLGVKSLSVYFNMANIVGAAYIGSFTSMRIGEIKNLKVNCLAKESDPETGRMIYTINGVTSKTMQDKNASWIAAPTCESAISMLRCVANLRYAALKLQHEDDIQEDIFLIMRAYEPWRQRSEFYQIPTKSRPTLPAYCTVTSKYPKLFDLDMLRITPQDLELAQSVTDSLNTDIYSIGKVWPLAWHQLRRTGAVNMYASGLVSDPSIQYQLKHTSALMTKYYGRGHYHVNLNVTDESKNDYLRARYDALALNFSELRSERYFSLLGAKRKSQILDRLTTDSHESLLTAARRGAIAYREVLLGACTNTEPCPFGGIDYILGCTGGAETSPCKHALVNCENKPKLHKLEKIIQDRLCECDADSPLRESLLEQQQAVKGVLHAIVEKTQ